MATQVIPSTDRISNLFSELEARKCLLTTCTDLYKTLSDHFQNLQQTLQQKSQDLDSKIESFECHTKQTLESLDQRESSIPDRESAAVARIEELRQSALSEFENPPAAAKSVGFADAMKSYCRQMDFGGLVKFLVSKRKDSVALRAEIAAALEVAVDSRRLVLDAVEEFVNAKLGKQGVADRRWACGVLVQAVFPLGELPMEGVGVAGNMSERAAEIAEKWKGIMGSGESGEVGAGEAAMFLQMINGFGITKKFEEDFVKKLVVEHPARKDMAKMALALGFRPKMKDIIDDLVKNGKEIEAVYFASESDLTEQFRPAALLKSYLNNSKKQVNALLKNGNSNAASVDQANNLELSSCKAIVKCVEDYKLELDFPIDNLKKRVTQLEKAKAEKKKSSASTNKPSNKRNRGGNSRDGAPSFRQSKAGRFSTYSPFNHRNVPQPPQAPGTRYPKTFSYPGQALYEGPGAVPYGSGYGAAAHSPSPAALAQQYAYPSQDVGAGTVRIAGSYGGQTNYGAYDYSAPVAAPAPHSHPQPHPPAYPLSYPQ